MAIVSIALVGPLLPGCSFNNDRVADGKSSQSVRSAPVAENRSESPTSNSRQPEPNEAAVVTSQPDTTMAAARSALASVADSNQTGAASQSQPPAPVDALQLRMEAKRLADELVRDVPNNPDALEVKARFHLLFGETEAAKQCWEDALRLAPDYAYALHGLGKIAMLNSNYEQAIDLLKRSLPSQPANAEPVHDLSDAYMKLGKLDESIGTLRSFADRNTQSTLTFVLLGYSYLAKGSFEQAETAFRTALQLSPGLPRAEQGLGSVLLRLGKREEAKQLLASQQASRAAANKNRSEQEVLRDELNECSLRYRNGAEVYLAHGDSVKAEKIARRAIVLNPQNSESKALLVTLYQKQGRLAEAIELSRELSAAHKLNPSWQYTLGILLAQSGDLNAARIAFTEVTRLAPANPIGYESLARLQLGTGKDLKATIPLAKKAAEMRGSAADHELLAQAYAINSDYKSAFESLSTAIRLDPSNKAYEEAMKQLRRVMGPANE